MVIVVFHSESKPEIVSNEILYLQNRKQVYNLLAEHYVLSMLCSGQLCCIKPQYGLFNSPARAILFLGVEPFRILLDDKNLWTLEPHENIQLVYALQSLYIEKARAEFLEASKANVQVKTVLIQTPP